MSFLTTHLNSLFNLFRKIKVRYEEAAANSLALYHLATATIALRHCCNKTG
jgi:hypothetical protein